MLPADLVAKLNQCATTDFGGPRDHWFNWLAGFTTMVAAGLVLEAPELAYELKGITREWIPYFRYRIITRPRREHAAKVLAFIGWILIVAGVAGERVAEVKVKDFDIRIQECSDAKVRASTIEAGDAAASADKVKKQADDLLAKYTAAERELIELRANTMPRRLSGENIAKLGKLIKAISPQWNITIISAMLDGESSDLANDLELAFKQAGWKTQRWPTRATEERGVEIGTQGTLSSSQDSRLLSSLREAVTSVGVPCKITAFRADDHSANGNGFEKALYLVVNHKPVPQANTKSSR